mmetsp:Transcript_7553/g.30690  ORF Transcript_7553/g.30690 Transcript_7553/m.30690 type:complete len:231 (+) Transcript_7553:34-726(+)
MLGTKSANGSGGGGSLRRSHAIAAAGPSFALVDRISLTPSFIASCESASFLPAQATWNPARRRYENMLGSPACSRCCCVRWPRTCSGHPVSSAQREGEHCVCETCAEVKVVPRDASLASAGVCVSGWPYTPPTLSARTSSGRKSTMLRAAVLFFASCAASLAKSSASNAAKPAEARPTPAPASLAAPAAAHADAANKRTSALRRLPSHRAHVILDAPQLRRARRGVKGAG